MPDPNLIPERPRLLIEACLSAPSRRIEAWQRWLNLTGFTEIDTGSFDLLPSVYYLNRGRAFPEMNRLRGLFRHNWANNQSHLNGALPLLMDLHAAGLDPMPIKGLGLALGTYGSLGARRLGDFDVLVPANQFARAADIAISRGFAPASFFAWPRASIKSWPFFGPQGTDVDLHARPFTEPWDEATEASLRAKPGHIEIAGLQFSVLSPAATLLVAILHGLRFDGRGYQRWIVDAGLTILGGDVDWELVGSVSQRVRVTFAIAHGLRLLAPFLPPGSIPGELLVARGGLSQRVEHAFRCRQPVGVLGTLPNFAFLCARERAVGLWTGTFSAYLREAWRVPPEQALTPILWQKARRRVASSLPRH